MDWGQQNVMSIVAGNVLLGRQITNYSFQNSVNSNQTVIADRTRKSYILYELIRIMH